MDGITDSMDTSFSKLQELVMERATSVRDARIQFLVWEDPLEQGMATHSCILAWKIPWREEHGRLESIGSQRVTHD